MKMGWRVFVVLSLALAAPAAADDGGRELYEKRIRPVMVEHCFACHSTTAEKAGKLKSGLLLDTADGLRSGGDRGPAIVPGRPDDSRLIEALNYTDADMQMPPRGKLPEKVIAEFAKWIELGAPLPKSSD